MDLPGAPDGLPAAPTLSIPPNNARCDIPPPLPNHRPDVRSAHHRQLTRSALRTPGLPTGPLKNVTGNAGTVTGYPAWV